MQPAQVLVVVGLDEEVHAPQSNQINTTSIMYFIVMFIMLSGKKRGLYLAYHYTISLMTCSWGTQTNYA